jgi:hypothetical protein
MSNENPYEAGLADHTDTTGLPTEELSSRKAAYNVVSDTLIGLNVRKRDNKFQAKFIGISVVLFAIAGGILALINRSWDLPWFGGAIVGAFAGLVGGFFASGIFLMCFRASRHLQGKHE